jgi:hypothetical protein
MSPEALRLRTHLVHELRATDAFWEARIVLHICGGGQLAAGSCPVGEHAFIEDGLELGARKVDGSGVGGGAGADNGDFGVGYRRRHFGGG